MAPVPVNLQQDSTTSPTTNLQLENLSLPTQEEAQICARMMETLLECRLQEALASEALVAPPMKIYFEEMEKASSKFVTSYNRNRMVSWFCTLTHDFHYCPEVFFRAASILDSFLSLMKVRPKFLQCVAATCFFIASKLEEHPESVELMLTAMLQNYNCEFSARDVYRMELIIMQKLDFKLTNHTPYDFLKIFHVVGITNGSLTLPCGLSPDQHLCHTALCMEELVCNHIFMKFRPSLLALAVLGCDLKLLGCDWLKTVVSLQNQAAVRGGELSVCYETVAPYYNSVAIQYPLYIVSPTPNSSPMPSAPPPPPPPSSSLKASPNLTPPNEKAALETSVKMKRNLADAVQGADNTSAKDSKHKLS